MHFSFKNSYQDLKTSYDDGVGGIEVKLGSERGLETFFFRQQIEFFRG
jgi:hypothetical protein